MLPRQMRTTAVPILCILVVAACGNGGGSDSGEVSQGITLGQVTDEANRLIALVGNADPIETANIPTTGSANYLGVVSFEVEGAPATSGLVGSANVDVDFAGNTVSGTMDNFLFVADVNADPETILPEVDGTLALSNGAVLRAGGPDDPQLGANFSGTLQSDVEMFGIAPNTATLVEGGFDAFFSDGAIAGELDGTLTPDGGLAREIDGGIFAEEQ